MSFTIGLLRDSKPRDLVSMRLGGRPRWIIRGTEESFLLLPDTADPGTWLHYSDRLSNDLRADMNVAGVNYGHEYTIDVAHAQQGIFEIVGGRENLGQLVFSMPLDGSKSSRSIIFGYADQSHFGAFDLDSGKPSGLPGGHKFLPARWGIYLLNGERIFGDLPTVSQLQGPR